jgi:hypothetical protein
MRRSVTIATEALYSEHFDMDDVVRRLANTDNSDQLLLAYLAIQVASNLSGPICEGDVDYRLQELISADQDALSLNKDLAEFGWSQKAHELLNRKTACRENKYSYEAAVYQLEKAKKGPSSYEEREKWKHLAAKVAETESKLEACLDEQASLEAAKLAFQKLLDDMKAQRTKDDEH